MKVNPILLLVLCLSLIGNLVWLFSPQRERTTSPSLPQLQAPKKFEYIGAGQGSNGEIMKVEEGTEKHLPFKDIAELERAVKNVAKVQGWEVTSLVPVWRGTNLWKAKVTFSKGTVRAGREG